MNNTSSLSNMFAEIYVMGQFSCNILNSNLSWPRLFIRLWPICTVYMPPLHFVCGEDGREPLLKVNRIRSTQGRQVH